VSKFTHKFILVLAPGHNVTPTGLKGKVGVFNGATTPSMMTFSITTLNKGSICYTPHYNDIFSMKLLLQSAHFQDLERNESE